MSLTRSPFRVAQATESTTIIVSHGSPSDPEPQEEFVRSIAASVAALTNSDVRGATLAASGALETAVEGLSSAQIYPFFMSDGWFVSTNLQNRLRASGLPSWETLTPLGMERQLPEIAIKGLQHVIQKEALPKSETTLVVAAHGSPSDPRPAGATQVFSAAMKESGLFEDVQTGFVDESPSIEDAAGVSGPAIVLPFFAARAGHVLLDLPEALEKVQFSGTILDPIGTWEEIPHLISSSLHSVNSANAA